MDSNQKLWPALPYEEWSATCETLHLWMQIVGKVKLALCPPENHWWHVALHLTARGLTSGPIPFEHITFQIDFDLVSHELLIASSVGNREAIKLEAKSVRDFYFEFMAALQVLGISVKLDTMPKEVTNPIRFDEDTTHASYDASQVEKFREILTGCDRAFREFRGLFCGKSSPVHFFWGSFDLTLTRFSGRMLLPSPAAEPKESVSEEFSLGFWPGSETYPEPGFYAYAVPPPEGYYGSSIKPTGAQFDTKLGEFLLKYDLVRSLADPHQAILDFAQSTYAHAADLGKWDRGHLECTPLEPIPS
ncbi:MAG: DUF5996 family protein [Candidatus Kapaibacterium sp.]|jgi:hypothetical protein